MTLLEHSVDQTSVDDQVLTNDRACVLAAQHRAERTKVVRIRESLRRNVEPGEVSGTPISLPRKTRLR